MEVFGSTSYHLGNDTISAAFVDAKRFSKLLFVELFPRERHFLYSVEIIVWN